MEKDERYIINLLLKSWGESLSQKEKEKLEKLLEDPAWAKLNADLLDDNYFMSRLREYNKYNAAADFAQFWKYVQTKKRHSKMRRISWWCLGGIAACVLISVGVEYAFKTFNHKVEQVVDKIAVVHSDANQDKIRLVLEDSDVVNLTDNVRTDKLLAEGIVMRTKSQSLDYSHVKQDSLRDTLIYHTVIIPQGDIFKMTLEDGTRVVLNAGTKMKYPVFFVGTEREVFLEGEAYFEVKKDEERPFIVSGRDFSVEVLGTSFDVMAYEEDMVSNVTLASGQIAMNTPDTSILMSPGQQVVMSQKHGITIRSVDVSAVTSWMEFRLNIKEEKLETIMKKLGKWYGVEVVYRKNELRKELYSGTIPYNISVEELLKLLNNTTNIEFTLNDGVIFISEKD